MIIRKLRAEEQYPMELLLLADPSQELVEQYVSKEECYVLEVEQNIVGVYVLVVKDSNAAELMNIAVAEHMQGRGLGKRLVLHAIEASRQKGCPVIEVGTGNSSIDQLALYQKCGFRIVGVDTDFFVRNYTEEIYENGIQCRDMIRLAMKLG